MAKQGEFWVEIGSRLRMDFDAALGRAQQGLALLGNVGAKALGSIGKAFGLGGFTSVSGLFDTSIAKAEAYDKTLGRLATRLNATGQGNRETAATLGAFASEMAKLTGESTDAVLAVMQVGNAAGYSADELKSLVRQSAALANRGGVSIVESAHAIQAAIGGSTEAIKGLVDEYAGLDTPAAILNRLAADTERFLKAGEQKKGGIADSLNKAREAADAAYRTIGQALAPVIKVLSDLIVGMGPTLTQVAVGILAVGAAISTGLAGPLAIALSIVAALKAAAALGDKVGEKVGKALFGDSSRVDKSKYNIEAQNEAIRKRRANMNANQREFEAQVDAHNRGLASQVAAEEAANAKEAAKTATLEKEKALRQAINGLQKAEFSTMADLARQAALRSLDLSNAKAIQADAAARDVAATELGKNAAADTAAMQKTLEEIRDGIHNVASVDARDSGYFNARGS